MSTPHAAKLLNDDRLLGIRDSWFTSLGSLFDGKHRNTVFAMNGYRGTSKANVLKVPEVWVEDALADLAEKIGVIEDKIVFRPRCIEGGLYGVHFIDKILGAEVYFDEESRQWYNKYLPTPVGSLRYPDLDRDETWNIAKRVAYAFLGQNVGLPLFGHPTIGSVLNIAVNLYGEDVLVKMHVEPENAEKDLRVIHRLLCDVHRWYRTHIPLKQLIGPISWLRAQPPGYGQLCGCTTQLVSGDMYRRFIAPLDDELLSLYPNGGMIHLCGSHTQHIPAWREMKSLRTIQLCNRAAADLEIYYKELREDQIIYFEPCDEMSVERAVEITGGKRLVVEGNIERAIPIG